MSDLHPSHEPHPWSELAPDQVLEALVYELYAPVSALGNEVDRLATGAFEDEELLELIEQIREAVNSLGRVVVALKQYTAERRSTTSLDTETPPAEE